MTFWAIITNSATFLNPSGHSENHTYALRSEMKELHINRLGLRNDNFPLLGEEIERHRQK